MNRNVLRVIVQVYRLCSKSQLHVARARAASASCSASISTLKQYACVCWRPLPTYYIRLCAWSESTWDPMCLIYRCGQQKHSVCDTRGPYQTIRSIIKLNFRLFQRINYACESLRCLDLEIWRFSCPWQTKTITLPLAVYACGGNHSMQWTFTI
jgi:hypothetical protein